ncbi:hypothetical protein O7630_26580 [Micromonospora sp. WMMD718]|uniref:hypothetical protein n=1 Tax=unclassified Micromonospora TaxID=2617518 RepID=UPI00064B91F1|nr:MULTISPECIES: hypothetical protein [unclassified Micromonospora]MDG4754515.1 hypothetical protein [Micromonospora sp. WMMD718]
MLDDAAAHARRYLIDFIDGNRGEEVVRELQRTDASGRRRPFDVSVASLDTDLSFLTKRATLVTAKLVLSQPGGEHRYLVNREICKRCGEDPDHCGPRCRYEDIRIDQLFAECDDLGRLGAYLRDCAPLLELGQLVYFPQTFRRSHLESRAPDAQSTSSLFDTSGRIELGDNPDRTLDLIVKGHRVVDVPSGDPVKARLVTPLLQLDLPMLEGTSLRDYCAILTQEGDALAATQAYLRGRMLEVDTDPDRALVQLVKLDAEIQEGVRAARAEVARVARRSAVQAAGAAVATVAATLVAVEGTQLAPVLGMLGAGGFFSAVLAADQYADRRGELRQRPFYLLWLLSRRSEPV